MRAAHSHRMECPGGWVVGIYAYADVVCAGWRHCVMDGSKWFDLDSSVRPFVRSFVQRRRKQAPTTTNCVVRSFGEQTNIANVFASQATGEVNTTHDIHRCGWLTCWAAACGRTDWSPHTVNNTEITLPLLGCPADEHQARGRCRQSRLTAVLRRGWLLWNLHQPKRKRGRECPVGEHTHTPHTPHAYLHTYTHPSRYKSRRTHRTSIPPYSVSFARLPLLSVTHSLTHSLTQHVGT